MPKTRYYPKDVKNSLAIRSKECCECCGAAITIDKHHILDFASGGENTLENLICLCPSCHRQIPKYLTQEQQKFLIELNHAEKSSSQHKMKTSINVFVIGSNKYIECDSILVMDGINIISPSHHGDSFYLNIVMLDNFDHKLLIFNNRVIFSSSDITVESKSKYFSLTEDNKKEKIVEIREVKGTVIVNLNFSYRGKPFHFGDDKTTLEGISMASSVIQGSKIALFVDTGQIFRTGIPSQ
jgi:hypothetical protein